MNIKNLIRKEALVKEATTYHLKNVKLSKEEIDTIKAETEYAIEKVAKVIQREANKEDKNDMSYFEAEEEARSFMKNYLKGVYGK